MRIIKSFEAYLPKGPLAARLALVEAHLDETYFAWIGEFGLGDPYYYRLHSPVAFYEFDFHCGSKSNFTQLFLSCPFTSYRHSVFLTNTSPAKCHIHTISRQPNAGDYGKALLKQWETRLA